MIIEWPTTNEIKKFAELTGTNRRHVRFCKQCNDFYSIKLGHKHSVTPKLIENYHTKPEARLFAAKGEATDRYFGLEWEIVGTHSPFLAKKICKLNRGEFYCKLDGSVDLEFVSHPMSLNYIKDNWEKLFVKAQKIFKKRNITSWDGNRCGGHVHVSRKAFTMQGMKNALAMFQNRDNWGYLLKMSGRKSITEYYVNYNNIPGDENCIGGLNYGGNHNRYSPINFNPDATIEFRLFRGTINIDRMKANFYWLNDFVDWCHSPNFTTNYVDFYETLSPEARNFFPCEQKRI